jgi:hypothetical protein
MSTTVRSQPYQLSWSDPVGSIDTVNTRLGKQLVDANEMFDILFSDLAGVADDLANIDTSGGLTSPVGVVDGGTGLITVAQGDLLYGSAADVLSVLAKDANATRYLSNTGASNNPAWAQVNLANGVTGNLGVTHLNSGTSAGATTFWRGDGVWAVPAGTATGTVTHTAGALTASALVVGNAADDIKVLASLGTTTTLLHGNAAGLPTFSAVDLANDVTGNLPVGNLNGGSAASSATFWRGDGSWATLASANAAYTFYQQKWHAIMASSSSASVVGIGPTGSNTGTGISVVVDTADVWARISTASSGSRVFWGAVNTLAQFQNDPTYIFRIRTGSDITSVRLWWMLGGDTVVGNSDTMPANSVGVRYSTVTADAGFIGCTTNNAGTQSTSASIANIAASTIYVIKIVVSGDGTVFTFTVNGGTPVVMNSGNLPVVTTNINFHVALAPQVASSRVMDAAFIYGEFPPY